MTEQKEQTIWPSVYEQLEEMVNKCAISWWITKNWLIFVYIKKVWDQEWLIFKNEIDWSCLTMDYHWLFSKDSGIMEFVEFKDNHSLMLRNMDDKKKYYYMIMWPMTACEKVHYFVKNAIVPTIKSE